MSPLLFVSLLACAALGFLSVASADSNASNLGVRVADIAYGRTDPAAHVKTPNPTPKTLVLIDDVEIKQSHSYFFEQLRDRGHQLTFSVAGTDSALKLSKFGSFFYDHLILMAPSSEDLGEGITVDSVQSFIDSGRSIFIAVNGQVSEAMREIVTELGIDIDETGTKVQDHAQYELSDHRGYHDLVLGEVSPTASRIAGLPDSNPGVLFRGIGHVAQSGPHLMPVLTGSPTAYSYALNQQVTDYPAATGRDVRLVSAIQTRTNARVVFSGSLELFSNEFVYRTVQSAAAVNTNAVSSVNGDFIRSLSMWCFLERGLLRARDLSHHKIGAEHDKIPASYRVSDKIAFSITIEEYDGTTHTWQPYVARDVQLEFTMLDPYIRLTLASSASGLYTAEFTVPDVYGIYKFVIGYYRVGYANLDVTHTVSVHPFRHDEYERFIGVAYPYYTGAFTIMAAFFVFGVVFLYHKE